MSYELGVCRRCWKWNCAVWCRRRVCALLLHGSPVLASLTAASACCCAIALCVCMRCVCVYVCVTIHPDVGLVFARGSHSYPQWYPFTDGEGDEDSSFRFTVTLR